MNTFQRYLAQFRAVWDGMSAAYRFVALGILAAVLASTGAVYFVSSSSEYVALAAGLAPEDAGAITAQLDTAAIPYRLDGGGSTVLVPKDRLAKARVELASRGATARGGKGYELFDDVSLGATPFVQKVNYTRALQAELARSIMQLEPVASARVMIARAEPSPFVREQQPTTASVVLRLKAGAAVGRSTASGIVSLVARSVEGLRPENVTVVDSAGRLLSDAHVSPDGLSASELEQRRELESYLAGKAEELLARHLGAGRALVRVSTELNTQKLRETRETYSPEEKVVRSEQTVSSESGSGGTAGGAAGAASNTGKNYVSTGGSGGRNKEETTHTDYLVSKTTKEMENRLGGIQRLTVAAMVDLSPREDGKVISAKEVEDIVRAAVGFQTGRDEIKVSDVPLAGTVAPPEPASPTWVEKAQGYVHLARNGALAVAFAFLAATVMMLTRRLAAMAPPPPPAPAEPARNGTPAANGQGLSYIDRQRFQAMAGSDPQQMARLLTALMRGGSN